MVFSARRLVVALTVAVAIGAAAYGWTQLQAAKGDAEMLTLLPDQVLTRPDLVALAVSEARPVYAANCAACHGADLKGNTRLGAPDLSDKIWLYGNGNLVEIEETILYGIRAGRGQSHNVTEMPAFGIRGLLQPGEVRDVVQYLLSLNGRPNLSEAALSGRELYRTKGMCADCHGAGGLGDPYYGSANLAVNVWNNGGDEASLYRSIYDGVSHMCPAWFGVLPLQKIRALAIYLYTESHAAPAPAYPRSS